MGGDKLQVASVFRCEGLEGKKYRNAFCQSPHSQNSYQKSAELILSRQSRSLGISADF